MEVYKKIVKEAGDDFYLGYSTSSSDDEEENDDNPKNKKEDSDTDEEVNADGVKVKIVRTP